MASAVAILSLKGTLVYGLEQALCSNNEEGGLDFTNFLQERRVQSDNLSQSNTAKKGFEGDRTLHRLLQKKKNEATVLYTSALPQILFASQPVSQSLTLLEVNQRLISRLQKVMFELTDCERDHNAADISLISKIWGEFEIETHRIGWIGFRLSDVGISLWLSHCLDHYDNGSDLHEKPDRSTFLNDQKSHDLLWQLQYTHARCCTLLRLWQQVCDLPSLSILQDAQKPNAPKPADQIKRVPFPWLSENDRQVQLVHSLIAMADDLFWIPYRYPSKQYFLLFQRAGSMCQAFERFSAACLSGFPSVDQAAAIAPLLEFQAKFYLVELTQKMLEALLARQFKVEAPVAL